MTPVQNRIDNNFGVFSRLLTLFELGFCKPKRRFIKLMLFSIELSVVSFRIKKLKTGHSSFCHSNQFMRQCWVKNHDQREEKWHFS